MPIPNTIIGLLTAGGLWVLSTCWIAPCEPVPRGAAANPFGLQRSAYGSLCARLMKDAMHNYWHEGRSGHGGSHPEGELLHGHDHSLCVKAGRVSAEHAHSESLLEEVIERLDELEGARLRSESHAPLTKAHRRYLEATATWHLKVAYHLDPGDAALYEIMHYTMTSKAPTPEAARVAAQQLARETIDHALSCYGGIPATLTGAGAAINLLNNDMVVGAAVPVSRDEVREHWEMLSKCLGRYRELRNRATEEGWWEDVPQVRRNEVASYAALVEKLAGTIGRRLASRDVDKE